MYIYIYTRPKKGAGSKSLLDHVGHFIASDSGSASQALALNPGTDAIRSAKTCSCLLRECVTEFRNAYPILKRRSSVFDLRC